MQFTGPVMWTTRRLSVSQPRCWRNAPPAKPSGNLPRIRTVESLPRDVSACVDQGANGTGRARRFPREGIAPIVRETPSAARIPWRVNARLKTPALLSVDRSASGMPRVIEPRLPGLDTRTVTRTSRRRQPSGLNSPLANRD